MDDPLATANIPGGPEFLRRWHASRNANHPLRVKERQEAMEYMRVRQPVVVQVAATVSAPRVKRVKKEPPKLDPDGRYRL